MKTKTVKELEKQTGEKIKTVGKHREVVTKRKKNMKSTDRKTCDNNTL